MLSGYNNNITTDTHKYYTCQTCNSLFTCLDYYQKHRKQHAKAKGIILLTCDRCPFASEKTFNFNWHIMKHATSPHRCDVCASDHQSTDELYTNVNNNSTILSNRQPEIIDLNYDSIDDHSISQTIISSGKRSIATETDDDLILSSHITDSPNNELCHLGEIIDAQDLQDNEQNNESNDNQQNDDNNDNDEDDNATIIQDDLNDNYDDETEEEDVNALEEMNNGIIQQNNCDIMQEKFKQEHFLNGNELENIMENYNENDIGLQDESQFKDFDEQNEFDQMLTNGFDSNNINDNDMIDNLESSNNFNNSISYTLADNNGVKNNCDKTVQPLLESQPVESDIYEFNSDEDLEQPNKEKSLKSKFLSQIPAQQSSSSSSSSSSILQFSNPPIANFQIQPFINPSTSLSIASTSNRTNVNQTHIPIVAQMNANFIFPSNSGTFAAQNAQNTFFNTANAYSPNGTIRILPIHNITNSPATSQINNAPTIINIQNTATNNFGNVITKPTNETRKHTKKKNKIDPPNILPNNVAEPFNTPEYQSCKGKGKGNRKPRISFVSIINGITVGADGIRRKFHCSLCGNGKSFKTKSHLQRHMLTHTGEKPYQCNECGAKFNQSSSLRNHIIAIHTKKFPHICATCNKGFLMPAVLQKHIQTTGHQMLQ